MDPQSLVRKFEELCFQIGAGIQGNGSYIEEKNLCKQVILERMKTGERAMKNEKVMRGFPGLLKTGITGKEKNHV